MSKPTDLPIWCWMAVKLQLPNNSMLTPTQCVASSVKTDGAHGTLSQWAPVFILSLTGGGKEISHSYNNPDK